jgi:hypothetical protein
MWQNAQQSLQMLHSTICLPLPSQKPTTKHKQTKQQERKAEKQRKRERGYQLLAHVRYTLEKKKTRTRSYYHRL